MSVDSSSRTEPLILVTNDDGIHAPGIAALAEALEGLGEVVVVAPDRNQSAVAHSLSLHAPLRATNPKPNHWAIQGTPSDCVYLAVVELLPRWPTLVVSGVNAGANLSMDVHYSGTVSAAIEGTILGIPSFAVSLADRDLRDFGPAAQFARSLAQSILERGGLPRGTTLNVNVPPGKPTRHQMTFLGRREYAHSVHKRVDPRGATYYWIGGDPTPHKDAPGSDCTAVAGGIISVTPLMLDMSDFASLRGNIPELTLAGFETVPREGH